MEILADMRNNNGLPRHRRHSGITDADDPIVSKDTIDTADNGKYKSVDYCAFRRMLWGKSRLVVLAVIVFGALLCSDYSLLSKTADLTPHSDTAENLGTSTTRRSLGASKAATTLSLRKQSASESYDPPTPSPALSAAGQSNHSMVKYKWDGGTEGNYFHKNPYFPSEWSVFKILPDDDRKKESKKKELQPTGHDFFKKMTSTGKLSPCRLDEVESCLPENTSVGIESPNETDAGAAPPVMTLYNPLDEVRFWCGTPIFGRSTEVIRTIPDECLSENSVISLPYVFSKGPPSLRNKDVPVPTEKDMANAIKLCHNSNSPTECFPSEPVECPVPCSICQKSRGNRNTIHVTNTNWTIQFTMEGERYYPDYHVEPTFYRKNIFYATTSFKSEVPLPYTDWDIFDKIKPAVDFDKAIKGASFLARNCQSHNNRESVVRALIDTELRVDSMSACLHNANVPPGVDKNNKTAIQEQYLFHLAFENQNVDDYITEKMWGTLQSGTLPVYLGAPNIREHVPKNSIIFAEDFDDPQALAEYLIRLTKDKVLYQSYHKWRDEPQPSFLNKYEFTKTHSDCRMCKFVYARQRGLGWNHTKQEIVQPHIEHKTCRNANGLIQHPFRETWLSLSATESRVATPTTIFSKDKIETCILDDKNRVIEIDDGVIRRKVYDRDGVTDITIDIRADATASHKINHPDHYILRMETPIRDEGTVQLQRIENTTVLWTQDNESRVYAMASVGCGVKLLAVGDKPGTIEAHIPVVPTGSAASSSSTTRIRIVTEDIDYFHQDAENYITNFGDMMIRDFFHPIESYRYL